MVRGVIVHLDTNVLIGVVGDAPPALDALRQRTVTLTGFAVSAPVWFEFLCGNPKMPLDDIDIEIARALVQNRIIPQDDTVASLAARLFNQGGRLRGSQLDCMIAATAIARDAELFTFNRADFEPFVKQGLRLLS